MSKEQEELKNTATEADHEYWVTMHKEVGNIAEEPDYDHATKVLKKSGWTDYMDRKNAKLQEREELEEKLEIWKDLDQAVHYFGCMYSNELRNADGDSYLAIIEKYEEDLGQFIRRQREEEGKNLLEELKGKVRQEVIISTMYQQEYLGFASVLEEGIFRCLDLLTERYGKEGE